ncbi:FCHO2 protein, partial [Atractosteus spatula]|nr:FCHO2 protein [Atractosteus spatula]
TQGEKNSGFDVLYHNMKHGQISTKELSDFIRERNTDYFSASPPSRATIEEAYARSMTKLARSASNFSQLGTFAPVWDVFKTSTEKLAMCHLELVRKLQELIKEVQKYGEDQAKAHKKTKEEVAGTLEAVQNIQSISQALQKSKENYNAKSVDQERLKKEGATQRELDKAGVKAKKATESYKLYVEKYATAKTEFEQKMAETAQKFQDIEEAHVVHMKEMIQSYSQAIEETHIQIGEVQNEFVNNMENTTVESLIQKLAETKGTGKKRPGPIEFEECNTAIATEGAKPRKRKPFGIPGRRRDKDTDSTVLIKYSLFRESTEAESVKTSNGAPSGYYGRIDLLNALFILISYFLQNAPQVDDEGFCIRPEVNENDILQYYNFYSSSDSDDDEEPRKFRVEIKPVQPNNGNHQAMSSIDELKASVGNITLSPSVSAQMKRNSSNGCMLFNARAATLAKGKASCWWQPLGTFLQFLITLRHHKMSKLVITFYKFINVLSAEETSGSLPIKPLTGSSSSRQVNNDLLSLDPLFGPPLEAAPSSVPSSAVYHTLQPFFQLLNIFLISLRPSLFTFSSSSCLDFTLCSFRLFLFSPADLVLHKENASLSSSPSASPWSLVDEAFLGLQPMSCPKSPSPEHSDCIYPSASSALKPAPESMDILSSISWSQSQWISFNDELVPCRRLNVNPKDSQRPQAQATSSSPAPPAFASSVKFFSDDPLDPFNNVTYTKIPKATIQGFDRKKVNVLEWPNQSPVLNPIENLWQDLKIALHQQCPINVSELQFRKEGIRPLHFDPVSPTVPVPPRPTTPLATGTIVPPPRPSSRPKLSAAKLAGINEIARPFSPPKISNASPPPAAPLARAESSSSLSSTASMSAANTPTVGTSRGPSPVSLGSQDSLPIAVAFTESVNAYFKGADPSKCIVKITGDITISFPSGIIKIFTSNPSPAVLSFRLKNTIKLEQILPNQQLLYSDPSQSDSSTKDFWMNMQALTGYLRKAAEQNPSASYYNVDILKYQVSSNGIKSTPLNLAVYWKCSPGTTDVRVDYRYNPESMLSPGILSNVQVLVPVDGGVINMQSIPTAIWSHESGERKDRKTASEEALDSAAPPSYDDIFPAPLSSDSTT